MFNWQSEDIVCIYQPELTGWPEPPAMRQAAYDLLKAMGLNPGARRVLIKPNIVQGVSVDSGISVHPAFVDGIARYMREAGAPSIVVAEGGGTDENHDMATHFQRAGYTEWAEVAGVPLVDLNADEYVRIPIAGRIFKSLPIASTVVQPDQFVINVAKLKTHNFAITSLTMKNLQGVVVPMQERHMCNAGFPRYDGDRGGAFGRVLDTHERWANKICDILHAIRPDLNMVDGLVGRDGTGFERGQNYPCRLAIAGMNPVAVDTVASYLMGFDPEHLTYLRVAGERGLGPDRLDRIHTYVVLGGKPELCRDIASLRVSPHFRVLLSEDYQYLSYEDVPYANPECL